MPLQRSAHTLEFSIENLGHNEEIVGLHACLQTVVDYLGRPSQIRGLSTLSMGLLTLEPIPVTEKSKGKNTETEGEERKSFCLTLIVTV